jgi:hypothetical protein
MKVKFTTEEIINSLDGIERAEPSPFFYTRVHARLMDNQNSPAQSAFRLITRPAFVMAIVMLIVLVNGYIMYNRSALLQNQDEIGQTIAAEYGRQSTINPYELNEAP